MAVYSRGIVARRTIMSRSACRADYFANRESMSSLVEMRGVLRWSLRLAGARADKSNPIARTLMGG